MKTYASASLAFTTVCFVGVCFAQAPNPRSARIEQGKQVYDYWCAPCHGAGLGLPGFDGLPGTQQLRIKYRGTNVSPLLEERTDLVPDFVKVIVRQGVSFMPQFRKTEVSDADLEALATFLARNNPNVK
jgi:mono/diheme cytochrome c family protein